MTETIPSASSEKAAAPAKPKKASGGLSGKVLAELQQIAGELGITGTSKMRKSDLIDAIKSARSQGSEEQTQTESAKQTQGAKAAAAAPPAENKPAQDKSAQKGGPQNKGTQNKGTQDKPAHKDVSDTSAGQKDTGVKTKKAPADQETGSHPETSAPAGDNRKNDGTKAAAGKSDKGAPDKNHADKSHSDKDQTGKSRSDNAGKNGDDRSDDHNQQNNQQNRRNDDDQGGRRNRRNRNRGRGRGQENEPVVRDDDVLVPAAGIVDILDNYAFVRTTGYLPSENDVYVSMAMVRKCGLRKGDAVVGQVRQPREGERKEKFNPMVQVDSINGMVLDDSKKRVEFSKLTPLYPAQRLRLEGEFGGTSGRVIDLVSPIGKGQRGLIVSPPKAGKTMIMQQIANAITANNPECHLMIVLVDERPEEVTDFQRTVKGEVISSTFDRPASDHTTVAELAIERAKRLVELDHDVVVLLDGITRLGRAYNLSAPASGRIMSGGVDSSALYPPKKFFGAARNIEDGGSLTILATALVETGSRMDEVIFEEFKGTGNMELRLRRELADKRIFPAIDLDASSTRREELLMGKDELAVVWKLRRVLSGLDSQQGIELVLDKLKKTTSNVEFLKQISTTMPNGDS